MLRHPDLLFWAAKSDENNVRARLVDLVNVGLVFVGRQFAEWR